MWSTPLQLSRRAVVWIVLVAGLLAGLSALALAVGLGSKELVGRSLERHIREPGERPDKLTHV